MDTVMINVEIENDIDTVWEKWTEASHIKNWYFASEDWHVPRVVQNFKIGNNFNYRMEAKDGSIGFDFSGRFTEIDVNKLIIYVLEDDRKVSTTFAENHNSIHLVQEFEVEDVLSSEMQKQGWQAILYQFKKYVEQK